MVIKSSTLSALLILSLVLLVACASPTATPEQEASLERIESFPGVSERELYDRAEDWIARNFQSADDVIQLRDPDSPRIIARGQARPALDLGFRRAFMYTMILDFQDERMRVRYENLESRDIGNVAGPDMDRQWDSIAEHLNANTDDLIEAIEVGDVHDDW